MDVFNAVQHLLSLPDESDLKSSNTPAKIYIRDSRAMASTPVDVKEYPKSYVFIADMPGLKSSDIKLENGNVLTLTGERKREEEPGSTYLSLERRVGKFMRKFTLPSDANLQNISASCKEGVLTVTVPKIPPPEPKKPVTVDITVG
ncbi:hypothetical protein O6H91_23G044700 [Diphasiastrum complanatum]|uniref:Uncharacterized protein n=1 Tax=Diphasiastrum complanatum TaxID=34168 RepID=A0ACC2AA98_DIPCM|nr:hypothetical protein O6H91_23G044700 [Diphasiastrum complanatum]